METTLKEKQLIDYKKFLKVNDLLSRKALKVNTKNTNDSFLEAYFFNGKMLVTIEFPGDGTCTWTIDTQKECFLAPEGYPPVDIPVSKKMKEFLDVILSPGDDLTKHNKATEYINTILSKL